MYVMVQYFIYMHIKVIWSDNRLPVEIIIRNKKKKKKKKRKGIWIIIFSLNLWTGEIPWKHINADCLHDYD